MKKGINGLLWDISIVPPTSPELYVDGNTCRGTTWFGQQQIFLSADLNADSAKVVIIHELTHAFLWSTQMRIPDTFTEEEICDFVARWGSEIISTAREVYVGLFYVPEEE